MNKYKLEYPKTIFPFPDDKWKKINNLFTNKNINRKNIWKWSDEQGRLFLITYRVDNDDGGKEVYPISYGYNEDNKLGYDRSHLGWSNNSPLFNLDKIINNKEAAIGIFEGEKTATAAESHYPNLICTCYLHGAGAWNNVDWRPLKNREIILFPDNDTPGRNGFLNLASYLKNKLGSKIKLVQVPETFPNKWDVADPMPRDTDHSYQSLLTLAENPADPVFFNDLAEDLEKKRYFIIEDSNGKQFYDRIQRRVLHKDLINLLYQADPDLKKGLATNLIAESSPQRIRSTAFRRINKDIIEIEGEKYLNTYYPVKFDPLQDSEIETLERDIEIWKKHLLMIFNGSVTAAENFESTIAHDLQRPNYNRTFAWLLQSSQGVGKGVIFNVIKKLNGEKNVAHVSSEMLIDRYRQYLRTTDIVFCTEIEITGRDQSTKMNKLKELITEEVHPIEEKFIPTNYHHGHFKLYLSSNAKVPVKLENHDRRYSFNQTLKTKAEILNDDPEYFVKLWKFINDDRNIQKLYHYYNHVFSIPKSYDPHEPLETQSRRQLMKYSRPQIYLDLDDYLERAENDSYNTFFFKNCDFVNTRQLLNAIRAYEDEKASIHKSGYERRFKTLSEYILNNWLGMINAKPLKKGRPINIDNTGKRHWWALRNQDHWIGIEELPELRSHIQGKNPAPTDLFAYKETKKEIIND